MKYVYIYRVKNDSGLAPCVEKNILTLACCKGGRKNSVNPTGLRFFIGSKRDANWEVDEVYIIGVYRDEMLYCAQITDVIEMTHYFSDKKWKGRTDDIYDVKEGEIVRNENQASEHQDQEDWKRDIMGKYVLVSNNYVYLGSDAVMEKEILDIAPKRQEHLLYNGKTAEKLVNVCFKHKDGKIHKPNSPLCNKCGRKKCNDTIC